MQNDQTYTPGPWKFQYTDENGECFIIAANLGGMVGAALPWPTEMESRDFRRVIANARLIAAAPELLDALVMVRDADEDCKSDGLPTMPPLARAKVDAAISKAEALNARERT